MDMWVDVSNFLQLVEQRLEELSSFVCSQIDPCGPRAPQTDED